MAGMIWNGSKNFLQDCSKTDETIKTNFRDKYRAAKRRGLYLKWNKEPNFS